MHSSTLFLVSALAGGAYAAELSASGAWNAEASWTGGLPEFSSSLAIDVTASIDSQVTLDAICAVLDFTADSASSTLDVAADATLTFATMTFDAGVTLALDSTAKVGGILDAIGVLTAEMTANAGTTVIVGDTSANADATVQSNISVKDGATISFQGSVAISDGRAAQPPTDDGNAVVTVESNATLKVDSDSEVDGSNGAQVDAKSNSVVEIAEGSKATFKSFKAEAETTVKVGYDASLRAVGAIAATGRATLDGTLAITTSASANLQAGVRYKVFAYGSHTGSFDSVTVNGEAAANVNAGAGRRLLAAGEYEEDDDGVYYTPSSNSPASLVTPGWTIGAAGVTLAMLALH